MIPVDRQGSWCDVDGVERRIVETGGPWVEVEIEADERIPGQLLVRVDERGRRVARLPIERTAARRTHRVVGRWRGAEVVVSSVVGARARLELIGPPAVAERLGFDGDQHQGWTKAVRAEEVEGATIEVLPWFGDGDGGGGAHGSPAGRAGRRGRGRDTSPRTFADLLTLLSAAGRAEAVRIEGMHEVPSATDQYVLARTSSGWSLGFHERGRIRPIHDGLESEAAACAALLHQMGPLVPLRRDRSGRSIRSPFRRRT